jgi:hypothetical protein
MKRFISSLALLAALHVNGVGAQELVDPEDLVNHQSCVYVQTEQQQWAFEGVDDVCHMELGEMPGTPWAYLDSGDGRHISIMSESWSDIQPDSPEAIRKARFEVKWWNLVNRNQLKDEWTWNEYRW